METRKLKQKFLARNPIMDTDSQQTVNKEASTIAQIAAELMHSSTRMHMAHLKSHSYAAHMAMGDFYTGIVDLVDSLVEQWQGINEELLTFPEISVRPINTTEESLIYLRELYVKLDMMSEKCPHSELVDVINDIKACINAAKYKMLFLH